MKKNFLMGGALVMLALTGCALDGGNSNSSMESKSETAVISSSASSETSNQASSALIESSKDEPAYFETIDGYIDSLMENTTDKIPYWNQESFKGKWNYIDGVMLNSFMNLYKETNDQKYLNFVTRFVNYYIDKSGKFLNLNDSKKSGFDGKALDDICESRILFDLYKYTNDSRYLKAINTTYLALTNTSRTNEGNFWHKKVYPNQVWLDGLYMANPFYLEYANNNTNAKALVNGKEMTIYDDILNQYKMVRKNMYDENKHLYYHGYDSSKSIFWADKETGCSKSFWLRSMGWYIVSLVDVIEKYPDSYSANKKELINIFKEAINGILEYQDSNTKMFYQVVDKKDVTVFVDGSYYPKTGVGKNVTNYVETSGSSMIAYALMKGYHLNLFDKAMYDKGVEIFNGICKKYLTISSSGINLDGICITAGLGPESSPYRDGSIEYYLSESVGSNDAKGVGPFVMAYIEMKNN